jgi:hypothetical protein
MAHGGHHSHSHSHHHHYHRSGSGSSSGVELAICIIAILVFLFISAISSDISGKKPLEGTYETYSSYVIDKEEYFSNTNELISGLKDLHEKTNVQIVVMSSHDSWSDRKVEEKYYEMFNDEAHILLVIPVGWFSSTEYYAIGDLANTVIGDREIDYLLDFINGSNDGSKWNKKLTEFTEILLSE